MATFKSWVPFTREHERKKFENAIDQKDFSTIKKMLDDGFNPNYKRADQTSNLFHAVRGGDNNSIELLLEHGADLNEPSLLATCPSVFTTELLLAAGSNPNNKNSDGKTALHNAVKDGNCAKVELLLRYGTDSLLTDNDGNNAGYYANNLPMDHYSLMVTKQIIMNVIRNNEQKWKKLQTHPSHELLLQFIEDGELALVQELVKKGVTPGKEALKAARAVKTLFSPVKSSSSKLYTPYQPYYVYGKIRDFLIRYLRLLGPHGTHKEGPISTTGMVKIYDGKIPLDIIRYIAYLAAIA